MAGIYVHIPFCRRKCIYCGFYSVCDSSKYRSKFVDALLAEASLRVNECKADVQSIYIGGGTPSLLSAEELRRIVSALTALVAPSESDRDALESTIEVNPDDVSPELVKLWRKLGINRVSMGVQSLCDAELSSIGRRHDADAARKAYSILRSEFDNISVDLMFGLPGQTLESLHTSLRGVIEMRPEHVSVYSLTYEERTALTRLRDTGKIDECAEEDSVAMWRLIESELGAAGFQRYEISNYARIDAGEPEDKWRSRHNSAYWKGMPYIGLGPGAHSFTGVMRRENLPDISAYINYWSGKDISCQPWQEEILTQEVRREEMLLTRLRTHEGLSLKDYERNFGTSELQTLLYCAEKFLNQPHPSVEIYTSGSSDFMKLTDDGVMISDMVIADFF